VGDPDVEAECLRATAFLDRAIDDALADLAQVHPLGLTRHLSESGAGREAIQNNVKLAISGGQNETRDVLAGAIWAVLSHDLQATALDWNRVFDEFVRWMAPIGMSPRRIGADFEYAGVRFRQGSAAQLMFGVANRDPARFDQPDQFLPQIQRLQHMAFGAGPHFCAGAFVSRLAVAELSLPMLFDRLPTLELVEDTAFHGWAFRGPDRVVVAVA
jgi:cytochrome P450